MGIFSLNVKKPKSTWMPAAEAMAQAATVFEEQLDTITTGQAGVLVRPSADQTPAQAKAEMERALTAADRTQFHFEVELDESGYPWIVLNDPTLLLLASGVNAVGTALAAGGLAERVVAAVYPLTWRDSVQERNRRVYWIYQPRIRSYTPFVPDGDTKDEDRDHELEVRMEQAVRRELPTDRNVKEWFPIWGMPI